MEAADGLMYAPPSDFAEPDWDKVDRVHNWRNYVFEDLIALWPTLPLRARAIIAANLQAIADREEWD
ncbi:hypothetical protein E2P84_27405 [Burkholderia cepacia]|uniref:Uncharacterized protein n=1 Tax=Burkholderia cepacia TaxID=292 RepID=A0AAX2RWU0_BURCE|nr:hypothetical protein [Burkholderia cepacia]TES71451.1 hypothetical protein E2P84_27405 [Burkholderia cepacia]TES97920.1 hypothetical protein E3D36_30370 [Burkholderia cepacia]TEU34464.1 hypothetical protein E3D39_31030 [Burkholderia cepacia]TEU43217.1 hypothetical protein E3D38_30180 [Burkholderia cepacia]TEU52142.1 hypothetical protein E3D37_05620 [Burkholderia cepacia]